MDRRKPLASGADRVSVLYVEDHPVNVLLMEALFARRPGLNLVVATDGAQALCVAHGLAPALLLLDLNLPDCHGRHLLPLLRQLPGCQQAPAVAVTAESDFELAASGFTEIWPKPLDLTRVLARLDALTAAHAVALAASTGASAGSSVTASMGASAGPASGASGPAVQRMPSAPMAAGRAFPRSMTSGR